MFLLGFIAEQFAPLIASSWANSGAAGASRDAIDAVNGIVRSLLKDKVLSSSLRVLPYTYVLAANLPNFFTNLRGSEAGQSILDTYFYWAPWQAPADYSWVYDYVRWLEECFRGIFV